MGWPCAGRPASGHLGDHVEERPDVHRELPVARVDRIDALRREFPDVPWLAYEAWASKQDWRMLD